ncbi:hypothetical protein JIG36_02515 [Actinoplanes sp. LDG1-06]|uniref:Tellurite resistance protein TerB n=1 Tax=Paractinoplanes ovalisporus TaxID=2810368 RepID=A0ABS2A3K3_9ACTN|nr:hypothetical protein [Actinoplanes ovalisporus]MBM2614431.1 hypothetical protein [Actinoplanes ovalisporus]
MAEQLTAEEQRVLADAEAALKLINAALEVRGEGALELTSLEIARARTLRALDSLVGQHQLWHRFNALPVMNVTERAHAKDVVADALADVMIRVGHVRPPSHAAVIELARQAIDDLPEDAKITATDVVSATRVALQHLRERLRRLASSRDDANTVIPVEEKRTALDIARAALLHVATAGGLAVGNAPASIVALTSVATTVGWGAAINIGTEMATVAPPAVVQPAEPEVRPAETPLAKLSRLHRQQPQLDPEYARVLRRELLDDLLGSDQWSPEYRLARLEQLVMDGAVPDKEAALVRKELQRSLPTISLAPSP